MKLKCEDEIKDIELMLSVIDNGVGISEQNIPKLFINFNKLNET